MEFYSSSWVRRASTWGTEVAVIKPEYSVTKLNNYYLVNNKALVLKQQQQKKNHNKLWFLPARLLLPTP